MATAKQVGQLLNLLGRDDETLEGVDWLLHHWGYVKAMMGSVAPLPDLRQFVQFLEGDLDVSVKPKWNSIWGEADEENWLDLLVQREVRLHELRGTEWHKLLFIETAKQCGREVIQRWERDFLLRFSALPVLDLGPEHSYSWWCRKTGGYFYSQMQAGEAGFISEGSFVPDPNTCRLTGDIILLDTRVKPNKRQEWRKDERFCGQALLVCREISLSGRDGDLRSRFNVSSEEWDEYVRSELAKVIGVDAAQISFEPVVVANMAPQFYPDLPRRHDELTDTGVWCREMGGKTARYIFQNSGKDGIWLAQSTSMSDLVSFRPFVTLASINNF